MVIGKLQKRWIRMKEKWEAQTPKQKWKQVYAIGKFTSDVIGVTVYGDMKNYWFSYFPGCVGTFHISMVIYTMWYYFSQGRYAKGMECTCIVGLIISVSLIYYRTMTKDRFKVHNIVNISGKYMYADDKKPTPHNEICEACVRKLYISALGLTAVIFLSFTIAGIDGFYAIFFIDHSLDFLGLQMPFVDISSLGGYLLITSYEVIATFIAFAGTATIEIGVLFVLNAYQLIPELVRLRSDELNVELNTNGQTYNALMRFRNICLQIQDCNDYLSECLDVYYVRLFAGPLLLMYSISFSIFGQMVLGYATGYGVAWCNYLLLLIFCNLGDNTLTANDRITTELYNMQWYLLPPSQQRQLGSLIHFMQNGAILTIGPFGALSFETFSNMTKSIFRLTIALKKMFK